MDADGGNQRNITNHPDRDYSPSWSPDSKRIAFVSNRTRDFNPDIFVMDADGANPRNITDQPEDEGAPTWYNAVLSVAPAGKILTMWGRLKGVDR
jgi:TolB protein